MTSAMPTMAQITLPPFSSFGIFISLTSMPPPNAAMTSKATPPPIANNSGVMLGTLRLEIF